MIPAAMKAHVMAPKPGWAIRSRYGAGMLLASLPAGVASTPDEAISRWMQLRGLRSRPSDVLAFPKVRP